MLGFNLVLKKMLKRNASDSWKVCITELQEQITENINTKQNEQLTSALC